MGVVNCRLDCKQFVLFYTYIPMLRPESSVGIISDYGLDGPGPNPVGD